MSKFKVGDKVRCIDAPGNDCRLYLRRSFRVITVRDTNDNGEVQIKGHETLENIWWFAERFEKVCSNGRKP